MPQNEALRDDFQYACLFCRSNSEDYIARFISEQCHALNALVPKKVRCRRQNGTVTDETVCLFPGYIFLKYTDPTDLRGVYRIDGAFRLLETTQSNEHKKEYSLTGSDRAFAEKLFCEGGIFGISTAYYENDRIKVVSGPLSEYNGKILRVNHRRRTAEVQMTFGGLDFKVWLGFELMEKSE